MMKNLNILVVLLLSINCKAQTPIINIEDEDGYRQDGAYYKDTNNLLNNYEGVWLYSNGLDTLKIELRKNTLQHIGRYYEDFLIGEVKYVKNGNIKINTLPNINTNYNNNRKHTISGAVIVTNPLRLNCTDCAPGEKRVFVGYVDHLINRAGYMMLKKTTVSGQEAIKIFIGYNGVRKRDGDVIPEVTIPYGWYTLIKQ